MGIVNVKKKADIEQELIRREELYNQPSELEKIKIRQDATETALLYLLDNEVI